MYTWVHRSYRVVIEVQCEILCKTEGMDLDICIHVSFVEKQWLHICACMFNNWDTPFKK